LTALVAMREARAQARAQSEAKNPDIS
jgi:hypothetical protein